MPFIKIFKLKGQLARKKKQGSNCQIQKGEGLSKKNHRYIYMQLHDNSVHSGTYQFHIDVYTHIDTHLQIWNYQPGLGDRGPEIVMFLSFLGALLKQMSQPRGRRNNSSTHITKRQKPTPSQNACT